VVEVEYEDSVSRKRSMPAIRPSIKFLLCFDPLKRKRRSFFVFLAGLLSGVKRCLT
jgi:hypothetical protein